MACVAVLKIRLRCYYRSVKIVRTRPEGDGGRGVVFPVACGPLPHGCFSGVVEKGTSVASGAPKALLLVAVEACAQVFRVAKTVRI